MGFKEWFFIFVTEKGWYNDSEDHLLNDLDQETQDYNIGLTLDFFLEFVCCNSTWEQQQSIKSKFVKLDFANADCRDFLHRLVNGMMIASGMNEVYSVKHA